MRKYHVAFVANHEDDGDDNALRATDEINAHDEQGWQFVSMCASPIGIYLTFSRADRG